MRQGGWVRGDREERGVSVAEAEPGGLGIRWLWCRRVGRWAGGWVRGGAGDIRGQHKLAKGGG